VGSAIGQFLPIAIAIALSPLPIVAVVLMLATPRGRVDGPAFVVAWIVVLALITGLVVALAGDPTTDGGAPAGWVNWLRLILGLGLLGVGVKQWKGRPKGDEPGELPKWMNALDEFEWYKALAAGVLLSALNPKNLLLAIAGGAAIAQAGLSSGQEVAAVAIFVLIGTIGVAAPVVVYFAMGDRAGPVLESLRDWMARNNATIMAVLLLVIGFKLIGDAISGFSA
jgi:threonine/homoserine/homoserine lactone efflux protein